MPPAKDIYESTINAVDNIWLILPLLLLIDAITSPYAGIVHDARLYTLQALSHIHPGRYAKDLYLLFGSQDSFTIFSALYAKIILFIGMKKAALSLYIVSRILFFTGVLFFFKSLTRNPTLTIIGAILVASGQMHYIFFDINETFLTPRLAAHGLSLIALAYIIDKKTRRSILFLFIAGLIHPLIALAPVVVIFISLCNSRNRKHIIWLIASTLTTIATLSFINPHAIQKILTLHYMDETWKNIVFTRSTYLVPSNWSSAEWQTIVASFLIGALFLINCKFQRRITLIIFCTSFFLLTMGIFITYSMPITLGIQLQLWRSFWLVRIMTIPLALLISLSLWRQKDSLRRSISVLIAIPMILNGGATENTLLYIVLACTGLALSHFMPSFYSRQQPAYPPYLIGLGIVFITCVVVFIQYQPDHPFPLDYSNFLSFLSALSPIIHIVMLTVVMVILHLIIKTGYIANTLVIIIYGIFIFIGNSNNFPIPPLMAAERHITPNKQPQSLKKWTQIIPPGSLIFSDSISASDTWFGLKSSSYINRQQGAGVIFNRKVAIYYANRMREKCLFFSNNILLKNKQNAENTIQWCKKRKIEYIISRQQFDLKLISTIKGLKLFAVYKR